MLWPFCLVQDGAWTFQEWRHQTGRRVSLSCQMRGRLGQRARVFVFSTQTLFAGFERHVFVLSCSCHLCDGSGTPRVAQQLGIAHSVELAEQVDPMTVPAQSEAEIAQDTLQLLVSWLPCEWVPPNGKYQVWKKLFDIRKVFSARYVRLPNAAGPTCKKKLFTS